MRLALAAAAAFLLAACATAPRPTAEQSWAGRFSVTATLGDWRDSVSGRFLLERSPGFLALDLSTPVGGTVARIEIDAAGARARGVQIAETRGPDAEALTQQLLGFGLPVRGLPDWIEGRPMPDRIATIEPQGGPIERIEQDGWRISILERSATGTPRRLLMERAELDGAPAVKLQLVLDAPAAP
ncbi:MAG: outer membrane lipoprotein LolB [Burkholderiaceae bacterium]